MTTAAVLGVIAALVTVLLCAPIRIHLEIDTGAEARPVHWQVRWLAATWSSRGPRERRERRAGTGGRPPTPRRRRRRGLRAVRAALRTPGLAGRGGRLVRRLALLIRPCRVEGDVVVGFEDPADTGMVFGAWCALSTVWPGARFRLEPDFEQAVVRGRARADWSIVPATAASAVARFIAAPVVWRAAWRAWRAL